MKIVSLLFLLFVSLTLGAQDITGKWYGYPDLKNMRLRLEYHVEKAGGGYQVTLKIPDLSEKTYRADAVELADHVLTVNIADAQTRSILRLQADGSLKGTFLWEGYDFELLLTRTPVVFKRPQTPKEPFSYHSEEVTFQNADDGVTLAGTLTWPASGARCKAVVLVSGSGGQDRNNTFSEHKTFFVLADYLARHGIATLRVDDRGVGKSGGNLKESGLPDADADAVAAVNYLKQRPEINADSVGVIGHSEGAFVAFSMAARKEVPFIITLAGGGVSGSELLLMQRAALLRASGVKEDFIEKQYAQIGKLYYEDHKEEADGAYGQQMQAIADAFAAIDHMKEEVLKIKGARQCPQCGATVPEDTEFCGKCGAKLNIFED